MMRRVARGLTGSAATSTRAATASGVVASSIRRPLLPLVPRLFDRPARAASFFHPSAPLLQFGFSPLGGAGVLSAIDNTAPYVHVRESDDAALVELECPRFRKEDLHIDKNATEGTIIIKGKRAAAHTEDSDFEHFMFGLSKTVSFRRSVAFDPQQFDVDKLTWALDHGVLTITVPKTAPPKRVEIPVSKKASGEVTTTEGDAVVKTSPEEFAAVARAKWPPAITREDTKDGGVVYRCALPPTMTRDHIVLTLDERNRRLTLSVNYSIETRSKNRTQSQSVSYATAMGVPEGTTAADIRTEYDDKGVLKVVVTGTGNAGKPAAENAIPIQDVGKK